MTGARGNRKGKDFERAVVNYLNDELDRTDIRREQAGHTRDLGDIRGIAGWTLECKNRKNISDAVRVGVDEAAIEAEHAGTTLYAAIVKRPNKPVGDAYVVMPLHRYAELLRMS